MRFGFLRFFLSFLECLFLCLFLLLCILAMFAIHAITQIASKTEKLWAAQKTSSQFCVLVWYARRGAGRRRCERHSVNRSGDSLPQSFVAASLRQNPAWPPRRPPLVLRLFALALADGSGLPFSLLPPPAALESQTPQREPRALPRRAQNCRGA